MTLLIRHAESEWNAHFGPYRLDPGIPDPSLTAEGQRQAEALALTLEDAGITGILTSPYRRALQTAAVVNARLRLPVELEPLARERCAFSCDQGGDPGALAAEWPHLDFSGLEPVWWGGLIESFETFAVRCAAFRRRLAARSDRRTLLVVTHWGFIRGLTGREVHNATTVRLEDAALFGTESEGLRE